MSGQHLITTWQDVTNDRILMVRLREMRGRAAHLKFPRHNELITAIRHGDLPALVRELRAFLDLGIDYSMSDHKRRRELERFRDKAIQTLGVIDVEAVGRQLTGRPFGVTV